MLAKRLNNRALPSITGLLANGPRLPKPRMAVPLVITATRLPLPVYRYAFSGSSAISRTGSATPGLYAKDRSHTVSAGLLRAVQIFPGCGSAWYCSAAFLKSVLTVDFFDTVINTYL